jgi:hypothetical protein
VHVHDPLTIASLSPDLIFYLVDLTSYQRKNPPGEKYTYEIESQLFQFEQACPHLNFQITKILFTKLDAFSAYLKTKPLKETFPDYEGITHSFILH